MSFYRDRQSNRLGGISSRSAIESTRAIANLTLSEPKEDPDVSAIVEVLRTGALPVAKVADRLSWDTKRVAEALSRGGHAGLMSFSKSDDTTIVQLD